MAANDVCDNCVWKAAMKNDSIIEPNVLLLLMTIISNPENCVCNE